jgi:transposase, IS30 family
MEKRRYKQLSLEERELIGQYRAQGRGIRRIAALLERAPSTVSRELRRNVAQKSPGYAPVSAQAQADKRATGGGRRRKLLDPRLWRAVLRGLRRRWSPEQIAGDMKTRYPKHSERQVSHETIYVGLYLLPRGELRSELLSYLRQARKQRRPRARGVERRGQIPNMVSISERPASVETRRVAGHWEGGVIGNPIIPTYGNRKIPTLLTDRGGSRWIVSMQS